MIVTEKKCVDFNGNYKIKNTLFMWNGFTSFMRLIIDLLEELKSFAKFRK